MASESEFNSESIVRYALLNMKDDFIFNLFEIENFNNSNSRMRFWFQHAIANVNRIDGDIFEFGVYRGGSLLPMAILLKSLGSKKHVYGFDSFKGFPSYSPNDDLDMFGKLLGTKITKEHYEKHKVLIALSKIKKRGDLSVKTISSSGDFSENSLDVLKRKIKLLELDNITLVEGKFEDSVPDFFSKNKNRIFSANIDCDLYDGYRISLPYIWERLQPGGCVNLDEYYSLKFPGGRIATDEFCAKVGIKPRKWPTPPTEFERWSLIKEF